MSNTCFNNTSGNDYEFDNYDTVKDDYMDGDVEFDEQDFGAAEYLYDLATTTETAIALGSSRMNANYEALEPIRPVMKGCLKELSDRATKPVRFINEEDCMTISVNAPVSVEVGNDSKSGESAESAYAAAADTNSQPLALRPRTKLEFYSAESNVWMVRMHIARIGNSAVHIGFRVEAMHVLWDLTRTPGLRAFLHDQGATAALLNVFEQFCPKESTGRVVDAQGRVLLKVLDVCPAQWCEEEQMRALGLLSLANLVKADLGDELTREEEEAREGGARAVMQTVTGASPELFERIVDLCGRYMSNCGNRGLYSLDRSLGGAVGSALAPYNLARVARSLMICLYREVQNFLDMVKAQKAVCCGGPACLPATVAACDALHEKFERLTNINITEPLPASVGSKRQYIRSERIVVC